MKKFYFLFALAALFVSPAIAEEIGTGEYKVVVVGNQQPAVKTVPYDALMFTFWYDNPPSAAYTETYGIKVGVPFGVGAPVSGLEASVFGSLTDKVDGVQTAIIMTKGQDITGLQFSIVNMVENMCGLQLGVVNVATGKSFQIGIINYIDGACIPFLPVVNFKF